jgi:hypothetical protein
MLFPGQVRRFCRRDECLQARTTEISMRKTGDQDRRPSERTYVAGREVYASIESNGRQSGQTNTLTRGRSLTALATDQCSTWSCNALIRQENSRLNPPPGRRARYPQMQWCNPLHKYKFSWSINLFTG